MHERSPLGSLVEVIDAIGVSALARALGHKNVTTVSSWKLRGSIPVAHWPSLIQSSKGQEIGLTAEVLMRLHAPPGDAVPPWDSRTATAPPAAA